MNKERKVRTYHYRWLELSLLIRRFQILGGPGGLYQTVVFSPQAKPTKGRMKNLVLYGLHIRIKSILTAWSLLCPFAGSIRKQSSLKSHWWSPALSSSPPEDDSSPTPTTRWPFVMTHVVSGGAVKREKPWRIQRRGLGGTQVVDCSFCWSSSDCQEPTRQLGHFHSEAPSGVHCQVLSVKETPGFTNSLEHLAPVSTEGAKLHDEAGTGETFSLLLNTNFLDH